jgi:hypothetical protein
MLAIAALPCRRTHRDALGSHARASNLPEITMHGADGSPVSQTHRYVRTEEPLLPGSRNCPFAHGTIAFDPPDLIDPRVL